MSERHDVVGVVTSPDRPGNRGRPASRPVAGEARRLGLQLLQPERVRDSGAIAAVLDIGSECLVVAAYGQILPRELLEGPPLGAVNVHASLLPRWRGASPVARAILAGDAETGVSIMRMDEGLDTGPVYASRGLTIDPNATTPALTHALAELGADLLVDVLEALARGDARSTPQASIGVTAAPRLTRDDGRVDWAARTGVEVDRMVRALQPWPGVLAPLAGAEVQLIAGAAVDGDPGADPGALIRRDSDAVVVAARDGAYRIESVRPPGARPMTPAAYLRGRRT